MWVNGRLGPPGTDVEEARQSQSLNVQATELAGALNTSDFLPEDTDDENQQDVVKRNKTSVTRRLSEADGAIKITVQQVLEDLFAPPFSMKDFQKFLEKEHSEENFDFYVAFKSYERTCTGISSTLLQNSLQIPQDPQQASQLEKTKALVVRLIERFFTVGAAQELNVPSTLVKPMLQQINTAGNIHPDVFKGVLENVFAMMRLSSFPNFYKAALGKGVVKRKVTLQRVLDDRCRPPMSFNDFHQFLKKERSEENIEFYKALKEYKQICTDIPSQILKNSGDSSITDTTITPKLAKANEKLAEILKVFFNENSKYDLNIPVLLKKPLFHEIKDLKNIHPDVFDGVLEAVLTMMKLSSFPNFQKDVEKAQKAAAVVESSGSVVAVGQVVRASVGQGLAAPPPLLNRKTKSNVSFNSAVSVSTSEPRTSFKTVFSVSVGGKQSPTSPTIGSSTRISPHQSSSNTPRESESLPKITVQEVLEDDYLPPFSLKDFADFLHDEHSQENIQFYLALREYADLCTEVPDELLRHANPAGLAEASDTLSLASAVLAVVQILDRFFTKGAKHELNVPSNISKTLVNTINKKRNIHPEVFNDTMENVLQMLKLSSFPNFYKSAITKGEIKARKDVTGASNELSEDNEDCYEPILKIPDIRKFSTNNIFQKLDNWSSGSSKVQDDSFQTSSVFDIKITTSQSSISSTQVKQKSRRPSTVADLLTVLDDGYHKPYSLDDFKEFLKNEHSEENIQFYMDLQEYRLLCQKVPSHILKNISTELTQEDSPFAENLSKIKASMDRILKTYFSKESLTELNIPSKILKPFLVAVTEQFNHHPRVFDPVAENVLQMMKLSSFPNFQKSAAAKGALELKLTLKQVLEDQHLPPLSLNDFHNFLIRENAEHKIEFYLACKEFESCCEKIERDSSVLEDEKAQETSHEINQLTKAQNKRNDIVDQFFADGGKKDLKLPPEVRAAVLAEVARGWNSRVFDVALYHVIVDLKENAFQSFQREALGSSYRRGQDSDYGSQTNSCLDKSTSGKSSSTEFKPTLLQVLEDKCESPFSRNDFHQFVKTEHSEENFNFYMAIKDHQLHCERLPPELLRDITSLKTGTAEWFKVEPLKQAVAEIRERFLNPDSETEVNVPAKILKPLLATLDGKNNIHPEIFAGAIENVLTMLKLSSFPMFCKAASAKGVAKLKPTLLAVLEDATPFPTSLQDFREYLQANNSEAWLNFYFRFKEYETICSTIPNEILMDTKSGSLDIDQFESLTKAKRAADDIVAVFYTADGLYSLPLPTATKSSLLEAIQNNQISPEVFEASMILAMTSLKSFFATFVKRGSKVVSMPTIVSSDVESTSPTSLRKSETVWSDIVTFTKLLSKSKSAIASSNESDTPRSEPKTSPVSSQVAGLGLTVTTGGDSRSASKRVSTIEFKPTVLQNADFHAFLVNEHSEENFDFYKAVKDYQSLCPGQFHLKIERARGTIEKIQSKFLTPHSETELNIPSKILNPLLTTLDAKVNLHPEIFDDALDNVLTMMRLSSFPVFLKAASLKGDPKLKPTVQQVLDDCLAPPMSRSDFHDFLRREHSDENYEFYMAFKNYEKICEQIPKELLIRSSNTPVDNPYFNQLEKAKGAILEILEIFFDLDGKHELNVPIVLKGPLKEQVTKKHNIHPDVFQGVLGNVLMMLKLSSFPNFIKEASKATPKVLEVCISDGTQSNSSADDGTALSPRTTKKASRPTSWINMMSHRKSADFRTVGDEMKATVQEIWDNEFAPPFSMKDYEKYLADEGDTSSLEFYKTLAEYKTMCKAIPEEQLRNSKAFKDAQLSAAFFAVIQMLSKFFARGAKQDIRVPPETLRVLLAQVNEKRNIHPDVFQDSLEFILNQQKITHFPNFYHLATIKGSLKSSKKKAKLEECLPAPLFSRGRRLSNSANKLDQEIKKFTTEADNSRYQTSSLKPVDLLETKQAQSSRSDPTMEFKSEEDERGQIASFNGYANTPTSPMEPRLKRASSLTKPGLSEKTESKLDQLEESVRRVSVNRMSLSQSGLKPGKARRSSILADSSTGIKFGVLQVLEDQFSPPFSMKGDGCCKHLSNNSRIYSDFHRFLIREYSDENIDFYISLKEFKRICEYIPGDQLRADPATVEALDDIDKARLDKARELATDIIRKYFTSGGERELNVPSNILKPLLLEITQRQNVHPDVFKAALDNVLTMLRLSSFPNFYKQAIEKGPITLKYTLQQVLDDTLHPPVSLKDFHNFLVRDHSEENIEFYIALRRYQILCDKVPVPVLCGQSKDVPDAALFEACKNAISDIIARFISPKAPQELNVPRNLRNALISESIEKRNIHPDVFKDVLENVVTMLKLSSFPKFQKEVQVQISVDDSIAVKSPGTLAAPNEVPEDIKNLILEITDTSSRVSITHRILKRLGLTSFVFDDPADSSSTRDRISTMWKVSGEANNDVQFADMVTPAQLRLGLQQTLDDKIPPPLSCRDFRTYLKKEKKAHYIDFYLAVKKYRRLCEKVPEGILNNPSNASLTLPSQLPINSPIARIKAELNEIISKYCEETSKLYVHLTPQIKLFLNSEVNKNGNWTPHIFEGAINHVCLTMQRSSFPGFYKMATTKAKGVKLKIVGTKKTSKGVNVDVKIAEDIKEDQEDLQDDLLTMDAPESLTAGKLNNLLFQVLADKTSSPLSRNDFYLYLKKEHSEENFDFYMSIVNYRKICKMGMQDEVRDAAFKIIETFLLSNGQREICITSKVKTAILKNVETDNNFDPNIFNAAFLEILSILRASSFPSFISENSKDSGDEAGLNTIVPDDLNNEPVESEMTKGQDPMIVQVLQNRLSPPLSLADFYNYLILNHSEKDLEFILLMEHYRKKCKDIPEFVLRNGVTVHTSRNELAAQTAEVSARFLENNALKLPTEIADKLFVDLEENGDYHPDVFDAACKIVMDRLKNTSIPAFYTQGLQIEQGW
ncbi:UNVERIFIED_CONTAM: hypothetical protein HDU68_012305 [Siphonaria sp. JEL0065]|nr:hypothetical protein HDU68_012305 [Siphonaria sp. JEL0065]